MQTSSLIKQSLLYYWRTNLAVVLGVATAVSVLAGALLVGDSVRTSLRDLVVQRLGRTSFVISSSGFFREQLTDDIQADPQFVQDGLSSVCPLISLEGTVTHERSKRVASKINVYGVDERFWRSNQSTHSAPDSRNVFVSPDLAHELGSSVGDSILVQVQKPSAIPLESLHSKKEDVGKTLRATVAEVLSAESLGQFSIQPQQAGVRAVFVSLKLLQRELEQPDKANLILISEAPTNSSSANTKSIEEILRKRFTLADVGITIRSVQEDNRTVIALEHDSKMIDELLRRAAGDTAKKLELQQGAFFSYLANSINAGNRSIPYSLVTAVDDNQFKLLAGKDISSSLPPIVLNDWAASDLGVHEGDQITLEYYLWQDTGQLETKTATFSLVSVVPMRGLAADRNLVPEYPGITGSENLSDWDPPFPVDLQRVRQKDEDYWHAFKTTPKAFIPLTSGQTLWQSRFGNATSLRFWSDRAPVSTEQFAQRLRETLDPTLLGVITTPVRTEGLQASRGATDFGEYFLYFSFFLVVSALLLTTLFFKLGIEQRIREIGIMRAVGYGPGLIRTLFLGEGIIVAIAGSILGVLGAIGYGALMMFGLRTWWVDAVGTTALKLHVSAQSLIVGAAAGITAAVICVAFTLRGLRKFATRGLLAGQLESDLPRTRRSRSLILGIVATVIGTLLLVLAATHAIGQVAGFFGGGTVLLIALLLFQSVWLRRERGGSLGGNGWWPVTRLGIRNTTYRPARSILCIALIASAVFIIVAVDSFRHRAGTETLDRKSGTGGYPLLADSLLPMVKDPNSREGQEDLNLRDDNPESPLTAVKFTRFRVKPGDDASCLNLYQPRNPKIIAPTSDFIQSNRFAFQSSLANNSQEAENPWLLLNREFADGAVPVIADANSLTYVLHSKLGDDFVIQNGDREIKLRIVGALADSLFQSELLMSEANFTRLFPDAQGYRFFLIDLPHPDRSAAVTAALEDRLSDYGFDVQPTAERLANFHRVENTYLSTFQMLGGLGLLLGTIGLSAILLRNVLERRRELALMRAVGYNSQHFTLMIVAENVVLLLVGLVTGVFCAFLAISPVLLTRHGGFANPSLGLLLVGVLVSGLAASILATWTILRAPLLEALRAE
ncbi:MAG TPA: ABC transporter permease [Pyrinomonadaceae bacterium]|nr:ABC transporter permease [Pyrinomonadaceae bacterium]